MKKVLLLAAVAALTLNVTLWCSSITVTSPAGGVSWCLGSANTITWTKSGDMQDTVAIRLRIAGSADAVLPVVEITNGAPNNGSFPWSVPGTVPPGDYFIRVKTVDGMVVGDSATFKIVSSPAIIVTNPSGATWQTGSAHTIQWNKVCDMQNTVAIRLRTAGSADEVPPVVEITNSTANDGSFPWTVPDSVAVGSYFIRVKTVDGTVVGDSGTFHISNGTTTPTITVTAPDASSSWRPGSRQTISWTKSGALHPMANITLRREGAPESEAAADRIADGCANNGSRVWFIPESLAEGRYFVRVKDGVAGGVKGDSAVFAISATGARSGPTGPDTPIRADLEMPGVGVEYYNGYIVAWVKNNGPDSLRDHDVKFHLNFPELGGGAQIITKRITVPIGAEEGVQLLALHPRNIPDSGLRTSVSIDTDRSHIQDSRRLNQHREVRIYAPNRAPVDLEITISDQRVTHVLAGGDLHEGIPHHKYRLFATLHMRNNSSAPAEIVRVSCSWKEQYLTSSGWSHNPEVHAHGTLTLGPFRPGEATSRRIELEYKTYTFQCERRIHFELDPDRLLNDPNRGNNEVSSITYDIP